MSTQNKAIFGGSGKLVTPDEFAGDLVVENPHVKVGVGGFQGSGKSRTSAEMTVGLHGLIKPDKPLLVIGTEGNAAQWLRPFFEENKVPVKFRYTRSLADVLTGIEFVEAGHYFALYIDSLTHIYADFVDAWLAKNHPGKRMEFQWWGTVKPLWDKLFSRRFVDSQAHIIFTGRGGFEYDRIEDEETGKTSQQKSGVRMQVGSDTAYEPDLIIWMSLQQKMKGKKVEMWHDALVVKDRSPYLTGKTFREPKFTDFALHFNYIINDSKKGTITRDSGNASTQDILPEPEAENPKAAKKRIVLDEIKARLQSVAPSNAAKDRKVALNLLERAFGNPSWEHVKTLDLEILQQGLDHIKQDVDVMRKTKGEAA